MLPRLRMDLDFFPSPLADQPGLVIRDPFHYSDATVLIPPALVACLDFFDGTSSELDLGSYLVQLTGDLMRRTAGWKIYGYLANAGFLENENFTKLREEAQREPTAASPRARAHGTGYPVDRAELSRR